MVENTIEDLVKAFCYLMQVFERQFTFIKLSVGKKLIDNFLDHALNTGRIGVRERPRSRFYRIRKQYKSGFLGLGLGARVTIIFFSDFPVTT